MSLPRRLKVEPLEPRRLLAIILDPISTVTVEEGASAALNASFIDSSPGGSYAAGVRWTATGSEQTASTDSPTGSPGPLTVRFDYRYDTVGFISTEMKSLLETAAEIVVGRLGDNLAGFTSNGNNRFNATFLNPATGVPATIPNFSVIANQFIIFVAGRELEGDDLALAGAGGGNGTQPFFNFATSRGQAGVPEIDFAPWGGAIAFDTEASWHTDLSTEGLTGAKNDFLSVAMHELFHVLGFTSGVDSFGRFLSNGQFFGPNAVQEYDDSGSPPVSEDGSHWEEGLQDDGQEAALDPSLTRGQRKYPTELDFAALDDLGWNLRAQPTSGMAVGSNVYADNGNFSGRVRVINGSEQGTRAFQIVVSNVAPSIQAFESPTGRAETTIGFSTTFTDPGAADTHVAVIGWGDGTPQQSLTVNSTDRSVSGQHTYSQPGTYQAVLGVRDDDGGTATYEFSVVVTAPPRGDWQNVINPADVNNNSVIDPLDALLVINELNDRVLSDPVTGLLPPAPGNLSEFVDVTGDDIVAPQDALLVINQLPTSSNRSAARRPGSQAVIPAAAWSTPASEDEPSQRRTIDEALANFSMSWLRS